MFLEDPGLVPALTSEGSQSLVSMDLPSLASKGTYSPYTPALPVIKNKTKAN